MAEQHITPSSHSALTRESSRSSPSRVVGARWLREVRKESRNRRNRRNATSPVPRASRHSSACATDYEPRANAELRRSSRLVNSLPRSDYSLSERWSYGADVYETRYDTTDYKQGDSTEHTAGEYSKRRRTSSYDKKKHKRHSTPSSNTTDECIAYCTRSRTARRSDESVCDQTTDYIKTVTTTPAYLQHSAATTAVSCPTNQSEGGLLPLEERDYVYSPFSSSTITEPLDSDYSVYSPTANRKKGKKRKRSSHHSLSRRKSNYLIDTDDYKKRLKFDINKRETCGTSNNLIHTPIDTPDSEHEHVSNPVPCSYRLRNRYSKGLGPPTSTVVSNTVKPPTSDDLQNTTVTESRTTGESRGRDSTPPPYKDLQEAGSSKAHYPDSKLLIVPRDLPYLRQTNARRSIAAATGATLGACLTRGANSSQRQRQETSSKRQQASAGPDEAGGS
ncbi:unnamed protein product, partial [Leptidea sinapis]